MYLGNTALRCKYVALGNQSYYVHVRKLWSFTNYEALCYFSFLL